MRIGFIGLGRMGSGMARNLVRAGHEVVVFNRSREKAEALVADGARVADTPGLGKGTPTVGSTRAQPRLYRRCLWGCGSAALYS